MQIKLSIPDATVAELDRMRGDVTRSRFVQRLIEGIASPATVLETPTPVVERSPRPSKKVGGPREPEEAPAEIPLPKIARRHWA